MPIKNLWKIASVFVPFSLSAFTVEDVDPFIGTGKAGNCYPGAQAPFGMISWSPNTTFDDYASVPSRPGYRYDRDQIYGFTLTHISGVGCHVAQDIPIMPARGRLTTSPHVARDRYASRFKHAREQASPGYYRVFLEDVQTDVELTTTVRAGLARFTFEPGEAPSLLFRLGQSAHGVTAASAALDPTSRRLSGQITSGGFCEADPKRYPYTLYFVAEFDRPFASSGFWRNGAEAPEPIDRAEGMDIAAHVTFAKTIGLVQVRIGISYVSLAGAAANLEAEIPAYTFNAVRRSVAKSWNEILAVMDAQGEKGMRAALATGLYHNALQPSVFNDIDGKYPGHDRNLQQIPAGHAMYANFSNWDTYRTTAQLQGLLFPRQASDMAESLRLAAEQGSPAGIPIWGLYNNETYVMNGYSGIPWIANAHAFGATHFDVQTMKTMLLKHAGPSYARGDTYLKLGYLDAQPRPWDFSASRTLEYAIADFSLSAFCRSAGDVPNADDLQNRSQNTFNLLDPETGYLRPRFANKTWLAPFSPSSEEGFNEGNSAHYTWSIPHNLAGLIERVGAEKIEQRADAFFSKILVDGWNTAEPYFWVSNEPCFGTPYVYHWLGKPHKTQDILRRIGAVFTPEPDGLPGDDDVGAMSAYHLWISAGLYPAIPGIGGFALSAPLVDEIRLTDGNGRTLTVRVKRQSPSASYVESVILNGQSHPQSWASRDALFARTQNVLEYTLGDHPGAHWGVAAEHRPPSFPAIESAAP